MNITELDSYNLADAIKFNDKLNPRIWQGDKMKPQVREKLLQIAQDFKQSLGLSDLEVKDITVSGSNAGYTYTPNSDIDLHLVVDLPQADSSEVYRELFDAKKFQYNETHNISIGGYDVELYVENANEPPVSQGMYSVVNSDWINIPLKKRSTVNDNAVKSKYNVMKHRIESAIASANFKRLSNTAAKIRKMRQAGLDKHGELGPENLAYKMLRTQGTIKALYDARTAAQDKKLSLKEQPKPRVTYGFREDVGITPDGVSPSTKMFLSETDDEQTVSDFIKDTAEFLGIKRMPSINLHSDADWGEQNQSFGRFDPETNELHVNLANRHIMDVLRTTAHELAHCKQHEVSELPLDAGKTGSPWENEAHAVAGVIMRNYADKHPEMFQGVDLNENASGYIPKNKKEARDPRYSMAVTVDIKPGQVGKEANKLGLETDSQGKPALLMKTANTLAESMAAEFEEFGKSKGKEEPWDRDGYEPPGPEFEPQMPAGTTKIDVTDLTDWYRLGQDISDMDDADPEDYNQGPPQTVVVFPSDELEQSYLKQFKRLGLKTHDMDPDVEGGEDTTGKHMRNKLAEELEAFKEQDLLEVKMTGKNLAKLASDIKGVKVGLEFEMIVPNVSDDDDSEQEPDYDQDERVRDIDDAISFFDDGDHNWGSQIRRVREEMENDYQTWVIEQIDGDWSDNGFEYFQEFLDREYPFDRDDGLEEAEDYVRKNNPDLEPGSDEYSEAVSERLNELEANYAVEQWEEQGGRYDYAREEFDDEKRGDYSEQNWLEDQGIRYASDVINEYTDLTWPHWTTPGGDAEGDIKGVALDFMKAMGMSSVAIATSYHGNYEKWNGSEWVRIGYNKPDDCFTIEPDGSLDPDDTGESGLEFVSPPVPLEDVGTVMKKVQNWAGTYGAYTGLGNKTSMHTNISVPGYDLKNLDYVKAALLLGDEHVLREFERFGNSYAKPAIEKVRQLVKDKPEKARELLDKMQNQLNAEASKLIHSGVTDKFTSINTKDNRIEFRSPGGDYLTDIAENPKKLQDTINRMVVAMDAAMDPNKYKQEYQKKLYKLLSGQQFGREGKSGAKQEMKKDDKDLLNIFSRYAAGELPKQALKSFVRQAQLQRKLAKGEETGKMWWNVKYAGQRMEVVAANKGDAKVAAAKEWGLTPAQAQLISATDITPLRPYEEKPAQQNNGTYRITTTGGGLIAGDEYGNDQTALQRAQYWAQRRGVDVVVRNPQGDEIGRVDSSGNIAPEPQGVDTRVDYEIYNRESNNPIRTFQARNDDEAMRALDDHRALMPASAAERVGVRRAGTGQGAQAPQQSAVNTPPAGGTGEGLRGNWGFWLTNADRFARWGGTEDLRRFSSREAAEEWLAGAREQNPRMRLDIEVREIEPTQQQDNWSQDFERRMQQGDAAQGGIIDVAGEQQPNWEIRDASTNGLVDQFYAPDQNTAIGIQFDYLQDQGLDSNDYVLQAIETPAQAPRTLTRPGQGQQVFTGEWKVVDGQGSELYRFSGIGNNQADANQAALRWVNRERNQGRVFNVTDISVLPVMGEA